MYCDERSFHGALLSVKATDRSWKSNLQALSGLDRFTFDHWAWWWLVGENKTQQSSDDILEGRVMGPRSLISAGKGYPETTIG